MSFNIAMSGIQAINEQLNTTSNNIANAGTYGFKSSRANFATVYSGTQESGTRIGSTTQSINQGGGVVNTGRGLDAAINGRGFFIGKDSRGLTTYSRVGIFSSDKNGYLIDSAGHKVQGYSTLFDSAGRPTAGAPLSPLNDIQVPTRQLAVEPTTNLTYTGNMSSDWTVKSVAFKADDPSTYNSAKVSVIFDSLGTQHTLSQYFVKTGVNEVTVHYAVDNVGETAVAPAPAAPGPVKINYDAEGQIYAITASDGTVQDKPALIAADPNSSAPDWKPVFKPVAYTQGVITGALPLKFSIDYNGSTQYVGEAITTTNSANGHAPGTLTGLELLEDGSVMAQYSNGISQNIGCVALATFSDENALVPTSNTSWQASIASGNALDYRPGTGKAGNLSVAALEQSNVDITSELVSLLTSQHNYQANSKVISTESEMLQSLMQAL